MNITDAQIEFITNSLEFHGLQSESIKEDILDHICTTIETSQHTNFEEAYEEAIQKLGGYYNIKQLQSETKQLLHAKTILRTKKGMFFSGLAMTVVFSVGLIFKMFHWPYANMMLLVGFLILILCYFPLFFYSKYRQSIINYQS